MWKIKAPNGEYNGVVAGVTFVDGEGETDNPLALNYFRRHGYEIEEPAEDAKGIEDMTVPELLVYAKENDIDLGDATRKDDILAAIQEAETEV